MTGDADARACRVADAPRPAATSPARRRSGAPRAPCDRRRASAGSSPRLRRCSAGRRDLASCPTTRSSGTCARASTSSTTASRTTTCSRSPRRARSGSRSRGSPSSRTRVLDRIVGAFGIRLFVGARRRRRSAARRTGWRCASCATAWCACGLTVAALAGIYTLWSERPLLHRRAVPPGPALGRRGARQLVGRHPLVVAPGAHVALGEHPRHVRARLRVPRVCTCSAAGSTARRRGRGGSAAAHRRGDRRSRSSFVNPYGVALVIFPIELLSRGDILSHIIEWQSPDFRNVWGIALGLWLVRVHRGAVARPPPGDAAATWS